MTEYHPEKSRKGLYHLSDNFFRFWFQYVFPYHSDGEHVLFSFHRIGKWWKKNEEIDVVATNDTTNSILFGECKWRDLPVGVNIYQSLKQKAALVEWGKEGRTALAKKERVVLVQENTMVS